MTILFPETDEISSLGLVKTGHIKIKKSIQKANSSKQEKLTSMHRSTI